MAGTAGIAETGPSALVERMLGKIAHRGKGCSGGVAFARRKKLYERRSLLTENHGPATHLPYASLVGPEFETGAGPLSLENTLVDWARNDY
jgi:hypothetical protein